MQLKEYFAKAERGKQKELAKLLGISKSHMSQMVSGVTAISEERCVIIENFTDGLVSRKDLRPNNWALIWPELSGKSEAA